MGVVVMVVVVVSGGDILLPTSQPANVFAREDESVTGLSPVTPLKTMIGKRVRKYNEK